MFPTVLKTDENAFVRREIEANVINLDEVNFLCGQKSIKEWRPKVGFEDDKLEMKGKDKNMEFIESDCGFL